MKEQVEKFLNTLSPNHKVVFRTISKEGISMTVGEHNAIGNSTDNVYFLGGVNANASRLTDADIESINYIRLDIDIKKSVATYFGDTPSKEDILTFVDEIKTRLETNQFLKEWSYLIFSGGGCHIYYSNTIGVTLDEELTPKVWKLAMKRIYGLYDKVIEKEYLESDKAVCNAARIMRLPGTTNQKNGVLCEILEARPQIQSSLFRHVKTLGLDALKKSQELSVKRALEIESMRKTLIADGGGDTDLKYAIINRFPAYIIAQILLPQFVFDNKKNFKVNGKLKGYYYVSETNSICNGGSEEFSWGTSESCWCNFSLVQRYLDITKAETFKWFENKFTI